MNKDESLKDRVIVITGASSGAGRAIAEELARHGATLVLAARNKDNLDTVQVECEALGSTAMCISTDVKSYDEVCALADQAIERFGKIDVWVNNAGVLAAGEFDHTPMDVHQGVIQTNLMGYIHGAHVILPHFKKQNSGILINNISIGGFLPVPFGTAYSSSKFGLRGFSEALQAELSAWENIHICDLFPAFLDTPGIRHAANYTGKVLKPAPPVYDPRRVAETVYQRILHPRKVTHIGSASYGLQGMHALLPKFMTMATAWVMKGYFRTAKTISPNPGNVKETLDFGSAIDGGHGLPGKPKTYRKYIAGTTILLAGSFLLLLGRRGSRSPYKP
ncbi:MAG: SDR family oxidoreductase [Mucilaginibacter polytrichastri]|nr:SDR family oxidoreductase [Mucilaginibacter polytrichastri]